MIGTNTLTTQLNGTRSPSGFQHTYNIESSRIVISEKA